MDFEISDDGTLIRYSGAGGDVVIPEGVKFIESGVVFDNETKIKSLTLPKSFIGCKFESYWENGFIYNAQDNSVSNCFANTELKEEDATQDNLYSYLYVPWLPNLKKYIVHPENPVYESVDGVLYSKCRRFVIDIPYRYTRELTLPEEFEKVLEAYEVAGKWVNKVRYMGASLSTEQLDELARLPGDEMRLFAPKLTHCELCKLDGRWDSSKDRIITIMPELSLSEELVHSLGLGLLLGYCYKHQIYNEEVAQQYIGMLLRNEVKLYNWGVESSSAAVQDFYKEEWAKKRLPKIDRSSNVGAAHYLLEVVLRGSVQDLQQLLDESLKPLTELLWHDKNAIQTVDYAIALAIRYGGVEKLRLLLDAEAKLQRKPKTLSKELYINYYNYWVTVEHLFYVSKYHSAFVIASNIEVRNMTPLDEDERLKCLELLCDREALIIEDNNVCNMICTLALMCSEFKIASYLHSHGVNLPRFMQEEKEYLKDVYFNDLLYSAILNHLQGVVQLIELAASDGKTFSIPTCYIPVIMRDGPNEFAKIFNLLDVKSKDLVDLFEQAVLSSSHSAVNTIITSKHIKPRKNLSKLIDVATKYNAHEATAMLLERQQEFKNKDKTKKTSRRSSLSL
ncbi:MAG: hypothetical protein Q4A68_00895 [Anaerobiospirillum succiniciproducens]|uniref:hypothetical protein n=1 Tax=Anaerobiospirillum succiniciproducens TaxID=13335 RepID=UPI0026DB6AB7|nr:hypothetical protein [Anaerobiospirillum succiniciproducens]MDO4675138.1 hypothetical protein [Anaerobiospirillum succiniciproducens]